MDSPDLPPAEDQGNSVPSSKEQSWLPYVLPLAVFLLAGSLEPTPREDTTEASAGWFDLLLDYGNYPLVYSIKIALTLGAMAWALPVYRQFARKLSPRAFVVGAVGPAVWVGLTDLQRMFGWTFGLGERSAFNPLEHLADRPAWAYAILGVRLVGLVLVVPIIEEFFLRGFLMRFVMQADWWNVPIGQLSMTALLAGSLVPALMHPGEFMAAIVWFSLVTWLLVRTHNLWDCVFAHAVTNLLLGVYVLATGKWYFL